MPRGARPKFRAIEAAEITGHSFYARVVIGTVTVGRPYQVLTIWHDGMINTGFAETLAHARDMARAVMLTAQDEGATCADMLPLR